MPRTAAAHSAVATATTAVLVVALLAGCSAGPSISRSPTAASASTQAAEPSPATPSAASSPKVPQFYPDGTAVANKPYFDSVIDALLAQNSAPGGRRTIDALVAAGFDKANMQLTPDTTTLGRNADSVLFSVRIGAQCLLGQFSGSQYTSSVQAALTNGTCLVGKTRSINW